MLLLSPPTLRFIAPPGETHDDGDNDGDLHGSDDGGDEYVVQLLTTGHHVQDVEIQQLVALRTAVRRLAPAGRQVVSHLTLSVLAELGVVFWTGGGAIHKALPLAGFGHSVDVWFGLHAVVLPTFVLATSDVSDVDLELFEAGRLSDVAGRVVRHAVAAAHWVVVVSVTHDVTHAEHVLRVFITLSSKLAVSTFRGLFPATGAFVISISRSRTSVVVTGSVRHDADGPLLLAGGSSEVTLVLICVSVRSTDRDVLLMAVELTNTLDVGSVFSTGSSEATRSGVANTKVALLL